MAGNISSTSLATLASLLIVAALPSEPPVASPPQAVRTPASDKHSLPAKPSFPAPKFRTLELLLPEPFVGFKGALDSVLLADGSGSLLEQTRPGAGPEDASPTAEPGSEGTPSVAPMEEFPGAVPVAVPRLAANPKWRRVIEENPQMARHAECTGGSPGECANSPWGRWNDLVRKVSTLSGEERLQAVNEGVNALLTYASDDEVYGVGDYWATLQESLARGRGDCEDIAIAKMWLLNAVGVELTNMRLVVLKDTLRDVDHAVLSVVENGHQYVLDNTAWKVGRADWMRGYRPIYALSFGQSWIYGMRVPSAPPLQVAQSTAPQLPR